MKICVFTKTDDRRIRRLISYFTRNRAAIDLIICARKKVPSSPRRWIRWILEGKKEMDSLSNLPFPVKYVEDQNSSIVTDFLLKYGIDVVFLSKAGIIRKKIIEGPWKIINCHPGILPRFRGVGSYEWSVYEGGPLGVTAHFIDAGIDTGPIIRRVYARPAPNETFAGFRTRLDDIGIEIMADLAERLINGERLPAIEQTKEMGVLYTRKPSLEELPFVMAAFCKRQKKFNALRKQNEKNALPYHP